MESTLCVCVIVTSTVRVIAFWKKGVLPRDMGRETMDLECTNSLETEQHISPVPALVASSSPLPLAALLWAGMRAGLPRGALQRLGSSGVPCRRKQTFTSWKHRCEPFPWDIRRTSKYSSVLSCVCWLFPCYLREQTSPSLALGWPALGSAFRAAHAASLA